jgi:hypothetical protein
MHDMDGAINTVCDMVNELDELFAAAEQDMAAFIEARRVKLLNMQASSDLWDDNETESAIMYGPMDDDNYTHHVIRLTQAQSRPDARGVWSQTDMARWMRRVFFKH